MKQHRAFASVSGMNTLQLIAAALEVADRINRGEASEDALDPYIAELIRLLLLAKKNEDFTIRRFDGAFRAHDGKNSSPARG